ncbi:hypothetical protein ACFWTC_02970 [Streptomyces sp. NPDC058619]|uniref:hypothetical protein n=1 Tax=Streptomyces sp. NPDC058619 TaxID=3346559 RepID=UPI00365D7371
MNVADLNLLAETIRAAQSKDRTPMGIALAIASAGQHLTAGMRTEQARLAVRVSELETSARGCDGEGCVLPHSSWCIRAREFAAQHSGCTCGEPWKDTPQSHAGHCWLLSPPDDELEWHRKRVAELLARVAELEAERSRPAPVLTAAAGLERLRREVAAGQAAPVAPCLGELAEQRHQFYDLDADSTAPMPGACLYPYLRTAPLGGTDAR